VQKLLKDGHRLQILVENDQLDLNLDPRCWC